MKMENIVLSEVTQTPKYMYDIYSPISKWILATKYSITITMIYHTSHNKLNKKEGSNEDA